MHAHAAHERQRADKDDVLPNLRADAAAVIAAIGVRAAAAAELGLQQPVEQGGEGILRRFERGKRVGQHLPGGQRAVELHTAGGDVVRGEHILVAEDDGVLPAEDAGSVPAAQGRAE